MTSTDVPSAATPPDHAPEQRWRRRAVRFARAMTGLLGGTLLLGAGVSLAAVAIGGDGPVPVVLSAALAAWTTPLLLTAVALLVLGRWWRGAVAAAVLLVVAVAWLRPYPTGSPHPDGATVPLTVMSQNMLFGEADATQVVAAVRHEHPDVLVLTELTEQAVTRLDAAGLAELLPYRVARPGSGAEGTGLFSATPLARTGTVPGMHYAALEAVTSIDGHPVQLFGVHPEPPLMPYWAQDHAALQRRLAAPQAAGQTLVVAGDFNATQYNAPFHRLLDSGLTDAARARLWAWQQQTWPADVGLLDDQEITGLLPRRDAPLVPTAIRIDHVLVSQPAVVDDVHTVRIRGTDHLGVVARLRLRAQ
jgi:endonuclease/exonuclease/phosphatase (EEP) superfamily protein YafD